MSRWLLLLLLLAPATAACTADPKPVDAGPYVPPWSDPAVEKQGRAADDRDRRLPIFEGWIGDIYVYSLNRPPNSQRVGRPPCSSDDLKPRLRGAQALTNAGPLFAEPRYLPKGFSEPEPPGLSVCKDGTQLQFGRDYGLGAWQVMIGVSATYGRRATSLPGVPKHRYRMERLGDRSVIVQMPAHESGMGNSAIIWYEEKTKILTTVRALGLPLVELKNVALALEMGR